MLRSCVQFLSHAAPRACLLTFLSAAVVLLLMPVQVLAVDYWIMAYTCNSSDEVRAQDSGPVHWGGTFWDCQYPDCYVELDAAAARGMLRAKSNAFDVHAGEYDYYNSGHGGIAAGMTFTDLVFAGPASSVETTLNLDVHALLSADADIGNSVSNLQVDIYLGGVWQGGTAAVDDGGDPVGISTWGLLEGTLVGSAAGATIDVTIETEPFSVPTNTSLILQISLRASAASYDPYLFASASCNAGNTLSFPRDLPVFDLPPGYTVNSVEAGINDNQWNPDVRVKDSSWGVLKSRY